MPLSRTRDYMSIGEVRETIKAEFPDISISKIRFLEGKGKAKATSEPELASAPPAISDVSLSRDELKKASGLSEQQLAGLEDFGLIAKDRERFDGADLTVAKAGKGL